jgi:hypothetical protein
VAVAKAGEIATPASGPRASAPDFAATCGAKPVPAATSAPTGDKQAICECVGASTQIRRHPRPRLQCRDCSRLTGALHPRSNPPTRRSESKTSDANSPLGEDGSNLGHVS